MPEISSIMKVLISWGGNIWYVRLVVPSMLESIEGSNMANMLISFILLEWLLNRKQKWRYKRIYIVAFLCVLAVEWVFLSTVWTACRILDACVASP
jgi:hypothetical protein